MWPQPEGLNKFRYYKNNTSFPSHAQKNGHLVITTQHFQFVFLQNLVVRFRYNLGQNKN